MVRTHALLFVCGESGAPQRQVYKECQRFKLKKNTWFLHFESSNNLRSQLCNTSNRSQKKVPDQISMIEGLESLPQCGYISLVHYIKPIERRFHVNKQWLFPSLNHQMQPTCIVSAHTISHMLCCGLWQTIVCESTNVQYYHCILYYTCTSKY